jgi:glyoxylase-like metal-dependent hydrolase (beta-lactamase superfamily II)
MTLRIHAMLSGWLTVPFDVLMAGETGSIKIPVPFYMIEHPKGLALFDSGLRRGLQNPEDPSHAIFGELGMTVHFEPGEDLVGRLAALGRDVADIRYLVSSHLHFDHCGGNHLVPNAGVVIQKREWEAGFVPELRQSNGYDPGDYDLGQDIIQVDGEHDLFGDGSVVCVPTFGHTPGHQSLMVRLPKGPVVLTADACYFRSTLETLRLPRLVHDKEVMLASLHRLRALQAEGARLFFGHDHDFWRDKAGTGIDLGVFA